MLLWTRNVIVRDLAELIQRVFSVKFWIGLDYIMSLINDRLHSTKLMAIGKRIRYIQLVIFLGEN